MDPIAVIGIAGGVIKTAVSLSQQLYRFVDDTKKVSKTIADLAREVLAIEKTLRSIESVLNVQPTKLADVDVTIDESQELWVSVQGSLTDCHATLRDIEHALFGLLPEGSDFARQAVRQLQLNFRQSEITPLCAALQSHKTTLQLTLQMLSLRAAYLTPSLVVEELGPRIDEVRQLLQTSQDRCQSAVALGGGPANDHSKQLRRSAQRIISTATSYSGESEATKSVLGDTISDAKRIHLLEWIPETPHEMLIPPPESVAHTVPETLFTEGFHFSEAQTASTALSDMSKAQDEELEDSDSDDHLQSELVDSLFQKGDRLFGDKLWKEAQSHYRKGLQHADKLPIRLRKPSQLDGVQLNLATCVAHSTNVTEAEKRLYAIVQEPSSKLVGNEDHGSENGRAIRRCSASQLLAVVLYRQRKYEAARQYCRKAVVGRRRMLGKDHISHYESLYLMHQILTAEGSDEDASVWLDWIPPDILKKLPSLQDDFPVYGDDKDSSQNAMDMGSILQSSSVPKSAFALPLPVRSTGQGPSSFSLPPPVRLSGRGSSSVSPAFQQSPRSDSHERSPSISGLPSPILTTANLSMTSSEPEHGANQLSSLPTPSVPDTISHSKSKRLSFSNPFNRRRSSEPKFTAASAATPSLGQTPKSSDPGTGSSENYGERASQGSRKKSSQGDIRSEDRLIAARKSSVEGDLVDFLSKRLDQEQNSRGSTPSGRGVLFGD